MSERRVLFHKEIRVRLPIVEVVDFKEMTVLVEDVKNAKEDKECAIIVENLVICATNFLCCFQKDM